MPTLFRENTPGEANAKAVYSKGCFPVDFKGEPQLPAARRGAMPSCDPADEPGAIGAGSWSSLGRVCGG